MFPSNAIMALALVIAAALLVLDWYIWRTGPVLHTGSGLRTPGTTKQRRLERLPGEDGVPIDPDWLGEPLPLRNSATGENEQADHI